LRPCSSFAVLSVVSTTPQDPKSPLHSTLSCQALPTVLFPFFPSMQLLNQTFQLLVIELRFIFEVPFVISTQLLNLKYLANFTVRQRPHCYFLVLKGQQ
jgi:hypothetical protein